jgi:sterol-4alpha-carboxylate 3-dehydrogenase (decarboxylating)
MLAATQKGKIRFRMGKREIIYDLIYVGNPADAHILAAYHLLSAHDKPSPPAESKVDGECFNIPNDEKVFFWDFTRKMAATAGHPVEKEEFVVMPVWVGSIIGWISEWVVWIRSAGRKQPNKMVKEIRFSTIHRTLSVEKAKRVLGYKPEVGLDEGIKRGVTWWM